MPEIKSPKPRKQKIAAVKKEIKQRVAQRTAKSSNTVTSNRLKLLVTVVGRNKAEYFCDLLQSFEVNMQTVLIAHGTANAKMLGLLGLSDTDKCVILSVIQENKIPDALHMLEVKFNAIKDGKGVACTVPISSVIGALIYGFLSNNRTVVKENK
ncbi:MAG: hypothetical protein K2L42_04780 [Clostridia bacterium]|nr:hypothetical protein [Clostridia bacterium]